MPVAKFNHFNLRAEQPMLDRLRDFYVDVVGLQVGSRPSFNFPGYWLYLEDHAILHLVEEQIGTGMGATGRGTFDHVAFTCTGLVAFEAGLRQKGIKFRKVQVPGTTQEQLFVQDPAGNGVEFSFANSDD